VSAKLAIAVCAIVSLATVICTTPPAGLLQDLWVTLAAAGAFLAGRRSGRGP
jgi:hypothetical protein